MKLKILILVIVLLTLITVTLVFAQSGELTLPWFTIDGGGSLVRGGDFTLFGVIGQPDVGVLSGGDFALVGGFGTGVSGGGFKQVYLPLITR
jgi:hypothetical protein